MIFLVAFAVAGGVGDLIKAVDRHTDAMRSQTTQQGRDAEALREVLRGIWRGG